MVTTVHRKKKMNKRSPEFGKYIESKHFILITFGSKLQARVTFMSSRALTLRISAKTSLLLRLCLHREHLMLSSLPYIILSQQAMYDVSAPLVEILRPQWAWLIIPGLMAYMAIVRLLRYQRARNIPLKHGLRDRASYACMTNDQAQAILKDLTELEFPKVFGFSVIFALFKVGSSLERLLQE